MQPSLPATGDKDDEIIVQSTTVVLESKNVRIGQTRPKGSEMKRTLTQDEKDLADAGYEHLSASKHVKGRLTEPANVDVQEHRLPLSALEDTLGTSLDYKDASKSYGLTEEEAKARLQRDGPNVLTPTKGKSALRKVCGLFCPRVM